MHGFEHIPVMKAESFLEIKDTCMVIFGYSIKYYHIECAKELGNIKDGKIVDINKYPESEKR